MDLPSTYAALTAEAYDRTDCTVDDDQIRIRIDPSDCDQDVVIWHPDVMTAGDQLAGSEVSSGPWPWGHVTIADYMSERARTGNWA